MRALRTGRWYEVIKDNPEHESELRRLYLLRNELSAHESDLLLRGNRIIIWTYQFTHENHPHRAWRTSRISQNEESIATESLVQWNWRVSTESCWWMSTMSTCYSWECSWTTENVENTWWTMARIKLWSYGSTKWKIRVDTCGWLQSVPIGLNLEFCDIACSDTING